MTPIPRFREIIAYEDADDRQPFEEWIKGLRDLGAQVRIRRRLDRARRGNLGDWKSVGKGVIELREHFGPGYRLYIGEDGDTWIVLLCGGDKSSQERDIHQAQRFWVDYQESKK